MAELKVKIKNKRTRKTRVLSLDDFKKEFSNELQTAFKLYSDEKKAKDFLPEFCKKRDYKSDFYFTGSFRFNFNNYAHFSEWYIEDFV